LKKTALGVALGIAGGIAATALAINRLTLPNLRKRCAKIESKQIDSEIRLDILEYNHLHEDGHIHLLFEELD
jgi:hypothetical protein